MTILQATPHSRSQYTAHHLTARNHVVVSSDRKHRVPPADKLSSGRSGDPITPITCAAQLNKSSSPLGQLETDASPLTGLAVGRAVGRLLVGPRGARSRSTRSSPSPSKIFPGQTSRAHCGTGPDQDSSDRSQVDPRCTTRTSSVGFAHGGPR